MNCTITFSVNGEELSLDLETDLDSPLTDLDIIKVLSNNPDLRLALCDVIHNKLYNLSSIDLVTINSLIGKDNKNRKEGLLGNCGIGYLIEQFPNIEFPEGVEANILLVNNLKIGKLNIYGRVINSNGKELFIVTGSTDKNGRARDVEQLAEFLRVRLQLELQSFHFSEESAYYKNLQAVFTERNKNKDKVSDLFDLMLDFIHNKEKYNSMYVTNEKGEKESAYNILLNINNVIRQYSNRVLYSDNFVNTINQHVKHLDNNTKALSLDSLYGAVKAFYPNILEILEITSKTKFHEFFSKPASETESKLTEVFGENIVEGQGYATLLSVLFSVEPEFPMDFSSSSKDKIILKATPRTIQSKYGIEYETIQSFDIIENDYKGYKIYAFFDNGVRKFIPSRTYLTEDTVTKTYNSELEAKNYIDSAVEKQDVKKHSFMDFKFRGKTIVDGNTIYEDELSSFTIYSKQALTQESIIESLDIPLVKCRIYNGEDILFQEDRQNYSSFKKIVELWNISDGLKANILSNINNAEKIAIFIYKINELLQEKRDNEQIMGEIISQIENASKKAYYIASKTWIPGKKLFAYQVIPTNPVQIEEYKKSKRTPIISLMSAIDKVLTDKFGVTVNMQTSEEIVKNFPDVDANTSKAFIRDGQIYVNTTIAQSTDLLHEYTHLILGILKSDPKLRGNYELLMDIVSKTNEGKNMIRRLRSRYETLSEMDLMEEAFAKLFSNHIMGTLNTELNQIFQEQEKFLRDTTKIVFNNEIADIKSFYGKSLETVFTRFSSDVAALLSQPGLDFSSTKTTRMYSNWISLQVQNFRDGKEGINEQCYG